MNRPALRATSLLIALSGVVAPIPVVAQDAAAGANGPYLSVELNIVEQQADTCRLTFVAQNNLGRDASAVVFETVLFDRADQVIDFTLFDFKDLPNGSLRVRQFDLAGVDCASVGRVLLNDVHACTGADLTADICAASLRWTSRTDVEVMG